MSHKHSNPNTQRQKLNKVPSWVSSNGSPSRSKEDQNPGQTELHRLFPELVPITNRLADAARGAQFSGQAMYTTTDHAESQEVLSDVTRRDDTEKDFWFKLPVRGDCDSRFGGGDRLSELTNHNKPHSVQKLVIKLKPFKQRTVAEALLERGDEEVKEPMFMKRPSLWKDSTGLRGTSKSWRELREGWDKMAFC